MKDVKNNWYKDFFNKYYLPLYLKKDIFSPIKVEREVNFLIKILNLSKNSKILDLPCGQGRHSILLAKKGYMVTGVDLSKTLLNSARKSAKKEKVDLRLIRNDMRKIIFKNEFDAVINLFTSFGYFEQEKEDIRVLKNINQSLKPKGKFILDLLNKNWFFERTPILKTWWKAGSSYILENNDFDVNKKRWINNIIVISPIGKINHTHTSVRLYSFLEIKKYLKEAGFKVLKVYGDYKGNKFSVSSPRMIILAKKIK